MGRLSYARWNALLCGQSGVICTATAVLPLLIFKSSRSLSAHSDPLWPKWTLNLQWKWKTPSQSFLKWRKPKCAKLATLSNRDRKVACYCCLLIYSPLTSPICQSLFILWSSLPVCTSQQPLILSPIQDPIHPKALVAKDLQLPSQLVELAKQTFPDCRVVFESEDSRTSRARRLACL